MKVLFIVPYPTEGASNRVRVEQFIPLLEASGIGCKIRPFMNRRFFSILYLPHKYAQKIFFFLICTVNRFFDLIRAWGYDVIFIHREAYPFGGPYFETALFKMKKKIIFDFDDAIFLPNTSEHNVYIERFKRPDKISKIIKMSAHVIAGNNYLQDFAVKFNKNVTVIPSSIDTEKYRPVDNKGTGEVVIGWIGSNTTGPFLYELEDVFAGLEEKYKNLKFKIIGSVFHSSKVKNVISKAWSLAGEYDDIRSIDIGVMPSPDNMWTRGKCGFKAILCMGCGIPVVSSPVGVNTEIVKDGINGFLAKDSTEWFDKLSILIEDEKLRHDMGRKGRALVEEKYSVHTNMPILLNIIKSVV